MKIGLCGLEFGSKNLGCGALSFAFLSILKKIENKISENFDIYVITQENYDGDLSKHGFINVKFIEYHLKNLESLSQLNNILKKCDFVFDFTAGDSFSDIYGMERFIKTALIKTMVAKKTKLILGPQTYGPFESKISQIWGKRIIQKAYKVFARDNASKKFAEKLSNRQIDEVIDVAFALPYEKKEKFSLENDSVNVGINVSGLLWNGGYTGKNQFSLTVNYQECCLEIIKWLLNMGYVVHLIGHVNPENFPAENDLAVCENLNSIFENRCIVAPRFPTPMEAKSYISRLDCLIGARMHATIAALSSGCAVIPFAYSRKFNGLYSSLNYPYVIDGKCLTTDDAIRNIKTYVESLSTIEHRAIDSNKIAKLKIIEFEKNLQELLITK